MQCSKYSPFVLAMVVRSSAVLSTKRLSVLAAAAAVLMSLLLGTNAAQAADVIFEPGTNRAIGVENLQIGGMSYDATFKVQSFAHEVYGSFPGTYTFTTIASADEARNEIVAALNVADALSVGESGVDVDSLFFNVGHEGEVILDVEFVITERAGMDELDWVPLGENQWTYNLDERTYVVFNGGGDPPPVEGDCENDLDGGVVCLRDGRFELTAEWTDFSNPPVTQPLIWTPVEDINASGGFQNNPSGIQIVMRIADSCASTNEWWIWLGGFTDAGWEITVRDTVTDTQQRYIKSPNAGVFPTTERDKTSFSCN